MIYIKKNQMNRVVLTLWESVTLASPYYAFRFTNRVTKAEVIFLAEDISMLTIRYNLFEIFEQDTSLDPNNGVINLTPSGQWKGEIFESATASLDPEDWGKLLQEEMVVVEGIAEDINDIYR